MNTKKTTPLRIVHVIQTLSPKLGGPVTVLRALAKEQSISGHKVTILTTNLDYPKGILTFQKNSSIPGSFAEVKYFPSEFPFACFSTGIARWLNQSDGQIDILHAWCLYRFPQTYSCYFARKKSLPYIIRPCGALEPFLYKQSALSLPLKRIYEWCFEWPNLRKATAINCVTEQEAINLPRFISRNKVFVLGNGIDWEFYKDISAKGSFRMRLELDDQVPLVLFLGRINFKKGLDLLIPAFARVLEKYAEACLAIVGPDNEGYGSKVRHWCRDQGIQNKVCFVGHLEPEEVKQAYVDADVFVLPSYTENFGMTVVEAMACGCPVVISDHVNIWREILEEEAGLVVGLDPSEISVTICQLLSNKASARAMGMRGRIAAKKRYAWPRIVEQMTQVYRRLIAENAAGNRLDGN